MEFNLKVVYLLQPIFGEVLYVKEDLNGPHQTPGEDLSKGDLSLVSTTSAAFGLSIIKASTLRACGCSRSGRSRPRVLQDWKRRFYADSWDLMGNLTPQISESIGGEHLRPRAGNRWEMKSTRQPFSTASPLPGGALAAHPTQRPAGQAVVVQAGVPQKSRLFFELFANQKDTLKVQDEKFKVSWNWTTGDMLRPSVWHPPLPEGSPPQSRSRHPPSGRTLGNLEEE